MTRKNILLTRILFWSLLTCFLAVAAVFYVQSMLKSRQAERELLYLKARTQIAQEQRDQMLKYQKRFEQQRQRRQYNSGGVVGIAQ